MDLFAGCGGMTLGFERSERFHSTFAVECDEAAAATYERNFGPHIEAKRIEQIETFPKCDVIIGGLPCQGFSLLNMNGVGLERRALWRQYLRALEEAEPSTFVMENVPELLRSAEYQAFVRAARKLGFTVDGRVLNAADYGVPQTRKRAFVIGSRLGAPLWPEQQFYAPESGPEGAAPWRTFREAVKGLPRKPTGKSWHNARNPRTKSLERYETIPGQGEGRFDLAERRPDITPDCWLRKKSGSTDVFGRLWWDRPAFTIRTEFYKPEKGRYLHPAEHRPITIREAARCMSFPDDFILPEDQAMTTIAKQVGNAVPPLLAQRVAEVVAAQLDEAGGQDGTEVRTDAVTPAEVVAA